mgnify:CR=1 FL=1
MKPLDSPTVKLVQNLLHRSGEIPAEQQANRIRFMERDVCLTIKIPLLIALAYYLYFSEWFEGLNSMGDLAMETVRGAFLVYCIFNLLMATVLLLMDFLPINLVHWLVFISNLIDGIFVALLVMVTGGIQSTIYWIFLFLVVRNAVSIPGTSNQLLLNILVLVCYLLAAVLDQTMLELNRSVSQVDRQMTEITFTPPRKERKAPPQPPIKIVPKAKPNPTPPAKNSTGNSAAGTSDEPIDLGYALGSALVVLTAGGIGESLLLRVALLVLLAICMYGINVLLELQLQTHEEEREFATRQHQLRSTGRLAAEIAHQLKNPLTIINNATYRLKRTVVKDFPDSAQQIQMIEEEIERSDRILTELMGYAKLAEAKVERLEVREEIEKAIQQVFPKGMEHAIKVTTTVPPNIPHLLMQRGHLNEILVNVLINSREALGEKGHISIAVRSSAAQTVTIEVADDGPGIPSNHIDKVFQAYFSTKERGTGLGLAIVRHNLEIYGGQVDVDSELGKGCRFRLRFPGKVLTPEYP